MNSEATPWIALILGGLGFLGAVWLYDRIASAFASRPRPDDASPGRAITGAAFAFQQVFDPGVEHVIRAENDLEEDDADPGEGGDDPALSPQAELLTALRASPIDPGEIRRVLRLAVGEGLDGRSLYDAAVQVLLDEQPYLAPAVPMWGEWLRSQVSRDLGSTPTRQYKGDCTWQAIAFCDILSLGSHPEFDR